MKKTRRWLIPLIIAVVVVLGVGGFLYYRNVQAKKTAAAAGSAQQIVQVRSGTLTSTIGATGAVRAAQSALINWSTSGTVSKVEVKLGDQVKTSQELAALDPATAPQSLIQAQADLITAQTNLDTLKNPTPLAIAQAQSAVDTAQSDLANLQNQHQISLATAQQALATAQTNLTTAKNNRAYLNQKIGSQASIDAAYAALIVKQQQVNQLQSRFDDVSTRAKDDPVYAQALSNLSTAKQQLATYQQNYDYLTGKGSATDVSTADSNLAVAQANYNDGLQKYNDLNQGVKASDLALAQAKVGDAQTSLDNLKNPKPEDIAAAQARVDAIKAELKQIALTAPFDGTITDLNVLVGDIVLNSTNAFRIDSLSAMYVDLQVSEVDINKVQVNQNVEITFDAILNKTYTGVVSEVGAAGTTSSGVVNFPVTVKMTDADAAVKPGMTASANVVTAAVSNALLVPVQAIHTVGNRSTVTLMTATGLQQVAVQLGASNDTQTQIVSGVKVGDRVVVGATTTTTTGGALRGGFGGGGGIIPGGGRPFGG